MSYILNDDQRLLVEENLDVIYQVIYKSFSRYIELMEYDDLYQAGALGLCKAAIAYNSDLGSSFSSFAFTVVKNELYDYLRRVIRHNSVNRKYMKLEKDCLEKYYGLSIDREISDVLTQMTLAHIKKKYKKTTRTGIEAISLKIQGYSCKNIAEKFDMDMNHLTACMSRAKKCLRNDRKFLDEIL